MTISLQELSDREELRVLLATLAQSGDARNMAEYLASYTESGILELPVFRAQGRENIRAALTSDRAEQTDAQVVRHNLTSSKISFESPSAAFGLTYFIVFYAIGTDHMGHYEDRFEKIDDKWLLAHRKVYIDWISEQSMGAPTAERRRALLSWTQ